MTDSPLPLAGPPLRIATRNSPLAMWQAHHVADRLRAIGCETELVPLVSGGDIDMRPIDGTRQTGVFTKRIQQALLDDEADVAVHSLKDLPTEPIDSLHLAAVPVREEVRDALVSPPEVETPYTIDSLPRDGKVGTGSTRRAAQLKSLRPDLTVEPIRGNVQTRLEKLASEGFAAIVLAEAGLLRLEMTSLERSVMSLDSMLPAPGQGALGIEVRREDVRAEQLVSRLDDGATRASVTAERTLLAALHGGCLAPIAALAQVDRGGAQPMLSMRAVVLSPDGSTRLEESGQVAWSDDLSQAITTGQSLGDQVAQTLSQRGAHDVIGRG